MSGDATGSVEPSTGMFPSTRLFMVHALDRDGAGDQRVELRPAHIAYHEGRDNPLGGPLLNAAGDVVGSCYIVEADSMDAARSVAEADPYYAAGLFSRVDIHEFAAVDWRPL